MKESRHSMEQVKNAMPTSIQPHYSSNERNLNNVSRAQVVLKTMKQPISFDFLYLLVYFSSWDVY
jgi:hypothetical protein